MSVIELQKTYDIRGPNKTPDNSLCKGCQIKGRSFLCLVIKKQQYPQVKDCAEYTPMPEDDESD